MNQFLHINAYGRRPRPGAGRHASAIGIINEASRALGASGHIALPQPPTILFGSQPEALKRRTTLVSQAARDCRGRKLRSDGAILMGLVATYPVPKATMATDVDWEVYVDWQQSTLKWLTLTFGESLATVIEHRDENYLHLHGFLFADIMSDGQLDWSKAHPGRRALKQSQAQGLSKFDQGLAYKRAMEALLDDYYAQVGAKFGHGRKGQERQRRLRREHLIIRDLEKRAQAAEEQLTKVLQRLHPLEAARLTASTDGEQDDRFLAQDTEDDINAEPDPDKVDEFDFETSAEREAEHDWDAPFNDAIHDDDLADWQMEGDAAEEFDADDPG